MPSSPFFARLKTMNTNLKPKLARFATATAFICPICKEELQLMENSLKCHHRHSYDLAKFGYVNLAPQVKQSKDYDKTSFQNRQLILEAGFYQQISDSLLQILKEEPTLKTVLDVGCGEGYYTRKIQEHFSDKMLYAFDISKDSVQLAAKSDSSLAVNWFVGDLAKLPLQDASMNIILDIFSPANYQEFRRVMSDNALLIKVIPTERHLQEIRQKAAAQLSKRDYSNQEVIQHFQEHFDIISEVNIESSHSLTSESRAALLAMTPLLFHIEQDQIDWTDLTQVTIAATILIGKVK